MIKFGGEGTNTYYFYCEKCSRKIKAGKDRLCGQCKRKSTK